MNDTNSDEQLRAKLQAEYDLHVDKYKRGCRGCIVGAWAIRDLAKKLGLPIKEEDLSKFRD